MIFSKWFTQVLYFDMTNDLLNDTFCRLGNEV